MNALTAAVFFVLLEDKWVRHPRNVVADDAGQAFVSCLLLILVRKGLGMGHPEGKQLGDYALGHLLRITPPTVEALNSRLDYALLRIANEIVYQAVEHALKCFVELQLLRG